MAADFLVGSDDGHEELLAAANAVINTAQALSSSFWRQMEPLFGFITDGDIAYLKQQAKLEHIASMSIPETDGCVSIANGYGPTEHERDKGGTIGTDRSELLVEQLEAGVGDHHEIPLYQRFMAALITEDDYSSGNEDLNLDVYGTELELDREFESNGSDHRFNIQCVGLTAFSDYKTTGNQFIDDEFNIDMLGVSNTGKNSCVDQFQNGVITNQALIPDMAFSKLQYGDSMQINKKLLLEARSIGIYAEPVSDVVQIDDGGISLEIKQLQERCHEQVIRKQSLLNKLLKSASETKEVQEKEFEQRALDKLVAMAYEKYVTCRGHNSGSKSSNNKIAKQAALAFVKRTLERCHNFEDLGQSCFSEQLFRDIFLSGYSHLNGRRAMDTGGEKLYANTSGHSLEVRVSASMGSRPSHLASPLGPIGDSSGDMLQPVGRCSEQSTGREDTWSNRVKKRELLLDDVVGCIASTGVSSGIGNALTSSTKGKRSERDREGKGHSREVLSRNGSNKSGRPGLSNTKVERKPKTKPKQKITQLSAVNGLLGKVPEQTRHTGAQSVSKSSEMTNSKVKTEFGLDELDGSEPIDFSQLPGIDDVLGDDNQAQDLGSWLNIDDDGLQGENDFMGLEIPMDDLADLNMMV